MTIVPSFSIAQEKRIALVIGISNYQSVPKLKNTINDSRLIAETLERLKFEVTLLSDVGLLSLRNGIKEFSFKAETSDIAMVYYAGHGVEFGGKNLLLPADTEASNRKDLADQSIILDELLFAVDKARQMRIVVLDSCRDDPFADNREDKVVVLTVGEGQLQKTGSGLAKPSPERGTLVAYSAEAGDVASDGSGDNSPFALALASNLQIENLEIGLIFRRTRDDVLRRTNNKQEPHTYGSLSGNPYFLSGNSTEFNEIADKVSRRNAWGVVRPEQENQLIALADDGDTRALKGLAYMRLNPTESRYDPNRAVELLQKAVENGDAEAEFELARLYEQGIGVEQNIDRALELYWKSAENNFPDAINDLGFLHFQGGLGIVRDTKKAIGLFERAADLRQPAAMFNFAALIDDGIVPGKTSEDAANYLYNSLRTGNEDVLTQLSDNPRMFKEQTRIALQKLLAEKQFYEGSFDADFGPQTKRGLRKAYGIEDE